MQIAGTWIWAVYPNSQNHPKKQWAASGGHKFSVVISSWAEGFEQRSGYVIIIASMYKNAYKTVLNAGLHCVIQCSPCGTGTVILSRSLMRKPRLRRKGSVTWGNWWGILAVWLPSVLSSGWMFLFWAETFLREFKDQGHRSQRSKDSST